LQAEPEAIALDVLYEDDDLLIVNKPAGMSVHAGAGNTRGTLVRRRKSVCCKMSTREYDRREWRR